MRPQILDHDHDQFENTGQHRQRDKRREHGFNTSIVAYLAALFTTAIALVCVFLVIVSSCNPNMQNVFVFQLEPVSIPGKYLDSSSKQLSGTYKRYHWGFLGSCSIMHNNTAVCEASTQPFSVTWKQIVDESNANITVPTKVSDYESGLKQSQKAMHIMILMLVVFVTLQGLIGIWVFGSAARSYILGAAGLSAISVVLSFIVSVIATAAYRAYASKFSGYMAVHVGSTGLGLVWGATVALAAAVSSWGFLSYESRNFGKT